MVRKPVHLLDFLIFSPLVRVLLLFFPKRVATVIATVLAAITIILLIYFVNFELRR
jgi:hypothetical protein